MFFYTDNFTHHPFILQTLSTAIKIASEFSPQKMMLETPATCKVIGSWLCSYTTIAIEFLCCHLRKRILSYHEEQQHQAKKI
jgi:hypothetical protein